MTAYGNGECVKFISIEAWWLLQVYQWICGKVRKTMNLIEFITINNDIRFGVDKLKFKIWAWSL